MAAIPQTLLEAIKPITVVTGHYGAGKTSFCANLSCDLAAEGMPVTLVDLDVVNPYFRATELRSSLETAGVNLIAPVFAEAGTSLDVPSLTGKVDTALRAASKGYVIVDAGGDDVGATALGRYARLIAERDHAMLYVANRNRNLVQSPDEALENLREIEIASHLRTTAVVNNSHLKDATTAETIVHGVRYAEGLCNLAALPLVCTTVPETLDAPGLADVYRIRMMVKTPWE